MLHLLLGAGVVIAAAIHLHRPRNRSIRIAKDAVTIVTVVTILALWSHL
ncbi:hypothetical protein [Streptomyces subrutilus]|nr:hypothetical protein [Streptomyces subrutilus]